MQKIRIWYGQTKWHVRNRAEVAVRHDLHSFLLGHAEESLLAEEGVHLDLERVRLFCGVGHDLADHARAHIADANVPDEARSLETLHGFVGLLVSHTFVYDHLRGITDKGWVSVLPLRRILGLNWNELNGEGEVNEVQVQVLNSEVSQTLTASELDMLGAMERIPKLGDNEEVFSCANTLLNGPCNALTNLDFITVVTGAIEKSVAFLDGCVDDIGADSLVQLPKTKSKLGHLDARSQGK